MIKIARVLNFVEVCALGFSLYLGWRIYGLLEIYLIR